MKAWTDYPFTALGDVAGQEAPIREVTVLAYDGNKYCRVEVQGRREDVKSGYLYTRPGWHRVVGFYCRNGGRLLIAPCLSAKQLRALPHA